MYDYYLSPSKHMFMAERRTQHIIHILTAIFHIRFQLPVLLFVLEHELELRMMFFSIVSQCFRSKFPPLERLHNKIVRTVFGSSTCTNSSQHHNNAQDTVLKTPHTSFSFAATESGKWLRVRLRQEIAFAFR